MLVHKLDGPVLNTLYSRAGQSLCSDRSLGIVVKAEVFNGKASALDAVLHVGHTGRDTASLLPEVLHGRITIIHQVSSCDGIVHSIVLDGILCFCSEGRLVVTANRRISRISHSGLIELRLGICQPSALQILTIDCSKHPGIRYPACHV